MTLAIPLIMVLIVLMVSIQVHENHKCKSPIQTWYMLGRPLKGNTRVELYGTSQLQFA